MKMKIISFTGEVTEKKLEGKNYSIYQYPVNLTANGQSYNVTLKSFTKSAMEINVGDELEVDKQVKDWNGKQMTDYIIKPEKKPFTGGGKYQPREKMSAVDFEKLVSYCWSLAVKTGATNPAEAFDKILGVASMNLDIASIPSGVAAVSQVFGDDEHIPF